MKLRPKILGVYIIVLLSALVLVNFVAYPLIPTSFGVVRLRALVITFVLTSLFFVLVRSINHQALVIRRVRDLTRQINHISDFRSFYKELKFNGDDEVAALAGAVNQMLQRIVGSTNEVSALNSRLEQEKSGVERLVEERTKQLGVEKTRLKSSVGHLSLGFIMTDPNGNVLLVNERAQMLLGAEPAHGTLAQQPTKLASPKSVAELEKLFDPPIKLSTLLARSLSANKVVELPELTSHGRILRILISPILDTPNSGQLGGVILLDDITEQKLVTRSKDEFFSIASHELRTPLTAIRGNAYMLKGFYAARMQDPIFTEMIDDIHKSSMRLIDIVNDFLDVSRLEQGKAKFAYSSVSIDEVAKSVAHEITNLASEKGNQIIIDVSLGNVPNVYADHDRVKQVVYNLIGNALKFTQDGSVTLSARQEGALVKVFVSDTGEGISESGRNLLFHKFQQAGSSLYTRETSRGTGLGLYISQLLVQTMGGGIGLEHSEPGKGSTFSFTLPVRV